LLVVACLLLAACWLLALILLLGGARAGLWKDPKDMAPHHEEDT